MMIYDLQEKSDLADRECEAIVHTVGSKPVSKDGHFIYCNNSHVETLQPNVVHCLRIHNDAHWGLYEL